MRLKFFKLITWITTLTLIFLCIEFMSRAAKDGNKEIQFYKSNLGREYILEKDTLKIIDYNMFNETFTLSNGLEINRDLLKK